MTASITIPDLDADVAERLRSEAARRGVAVTTIAVEAMRRGLPPVPPAAPPVAGGGGPAEHRDLDAFIGTWSAADAAEFEAATTDFGRVDRELWG